MQDHIVYSQAIILHLIHSQTASVFSASPLLCLCFLIVNQANKNKKILSGSCVGQTY